MRPLVLFIVLLLAVPDVRAGGVAGEGRDSRWTLTWSPAPLLAGVVMGSLEYRMVPLWSVAWQGCSSCSPG